MARAVWATRLWPLTLDSSGARGNFFWLKIETIISCKRFKIARLKLVRSCIAQRKYTPIEKGTSSSGFSKFPLLSIKRSGRNTWGSPHTASLKSTPSRCGKIIVSLGMVYPLTVVSCMHRWNSLKFFFYLIVNWGHSIMLKKKFHFINLIKLSKIAKKKNNNME